MNAVIKGAGYALIHTPDMVIHNGATQTTERIVNPESEYLKALPNHLRTYEQAVAYYPNQTYIGNMHPDELGAIPTPWNEQPCDMKDRYGKYGQIMPQEEFLLLLQVCDVFDLVMLDKNFVAEHKAALAANPIIDDSIMARVKDGFEIADIENVVNNEHAEGLYHNNVLVGAVKKAHDIDVNLSAHVMHENLASKASNVVALLHAIQNAGIAKEDVDYVLDCAEEACGDMNQRGGGNFAKSVAEIAGLVNATGADMRGFCAAPAHTMITAASLVAAGSYKTVIVTSGGCTAKLGMNGKDHVKKGLPILEDLLGGFAVVVGQDDGVNPVINLDILGRHKVGSGSAPQQVTEALVFDALDRNGMKVAEVDKLAGELHNSDVLKPAGGGDPAEGFLKVVAAAAIKRGDLPKAEMKNFIKEHGYVGWAPTQGHIPSGAPCIGVVRDDILAGKIKNAMVVGKGSLFLGRMTNLFDGVSFVIEANKGLQEEEKGVSEEAVKGLIAKALKDFAAGLLAE